MSSKMNKKEQLDFLARNVSEWPVGGFTSICYSMDDGCAIFGKFKNLANWFSETEWKQRRKELINKPDWENIDEDIQCITQDGDGTWAGWTVNDGLIAIDGSYWCHNDIGADESICKVISEGEPLNWKNSLEARPQKEEKMKDEFKPTHTVVESNGSECDVVIKYSSDQMTVVKNESNVETVIYAMSGAIVKEYVSPRDKKCEELFEKWKENQYNAPFQDVYGQSAALSAIKMILDEELLK